MHTIKLFVTDENQSTLFNSEIPVSNGKAHIKAFFSAKENPEFQPVLYLGTHSWNDNFKIEQTTFKTGKPGFQIKINDNYKMSCQIVNIKGTQYGITFHYNDHVEPEKESVPLNWLEV